jgi:hypothetical protein
MSRQKVNDNVNKWNRAIEDAQTLLQRAENRVARLKGAIRTFTELRDCDHLFTGPESVEQIAATTQPEAHNSETATQS